MGYLEIEFNGKCNSHLDSVQVSKENWFRFLDNCYILLDAKEVDLAKLFELLKVFINMLTFQWNKMVYINHFMILW